MRAVVLHLLIIAGTGALCKVNAYVPGLGRNYRSGSEIEIAVSGVSSVRAQVPFSYHQLPYCQPEKLIGKPETVGEILLGGSVENSCFTAHMLKTETCKPVCTVQLTPEIRRKFERLIDDEYRISYLADGLPGLSTHLLRRDARGNVVLPERDISMQMGDGFEEIFHTLGVPVGWKETGTDGVAQHFLYNYISIIFRYTAPDDLNVGGFFQSSANTQEARIVGFEMVPSVYTGSVACPSIPLPGDLGPLEKALLRRRSIPAASVRPLRELSEVTFFYDVDFIPVNTSFASRWDDYLKAQQVGINVQAASDIHWFGIANSLAVVLVLTGVVALILIRTLHRDIARYNELVDADDDLNETGWKLVHGDVFRKPPHSTVLAALTGSGAQLLLTILGTLAVGAIGVGLKPKSGFGSANLLQVGIGSWALMGSVGGYTAARFYKLFQSPNWKMTTMRTAMIYPGVVFTVFLIVNAFLRFAGSSAAVPFRGIVLLAMLWLGISLPLIYMGAFFGFKQQPLAFPVRVNRIPRQIPPQHWTVNKYLLATIGGALPFGTIFTELVFIFSSIWLHRTYLLFGVLFIVLLILIITCAEISIAMTYFQLVNEDYNWWWRSFYIPGVSAVYVFVYALLYALFRLSLSRFISMVIFVGYSFILAFSCFIITGAVGFMSAFVFTRAIYSSIRVD